MKFHSIAHDEIFYGNEFAGNYTVDSDQKASSYPTIKLDVFVI
jgi:hypothetical protein